MTVSLPLEIIPPIVLAAISLVVFFLPGILIGQWASTREIQKKGYIGMAWGCCLLYLASMATFIYALRALHFFLKQFYSIPL